MSRNPFTLIGVPATALLSFIAGCGGSANRVLESINISPSAAAGATASFAAAGNYNTPPSILTPQSVSWYIMGPGIDPPPSSYSLSVAPYRGQRCSQFQTKTPEIYTVIAVAPVDPTAPISGAVPSQVFEDLVIARKATTEGGFASATATLSCP
jgi:hypothetical protein